MEAIKAVFIGDSAVGKTALYTRLEKNTYVDDHVMTIGGAFTQVTIEKEGVCKTIGLWDTAGQERFRNVVPMYFQRATFIMIVYDVTSNESFDNIEMWLDLAKAKAPANVNLILIGNKADLEGLRVISYDQGVNKAAEIGAVFVETSAKRCVGIDLLKNELLKHVIEEKVPEIDMTVTPAVIVREQNKNKSACICNK